jgi:hypothetical protein
LQPLGQTGAVDDFRCAAASLADDEPLAGTAPTERAWLFVEYAGPWGRQAVAESRWPTEVREHLASWDDYRVQLIRRAGRSEPGLRVFAAVATATGFSVGSTTLAGPEELLELPLALDRPGAGLPIHDEPLWLVCTNGRRDRCCAELGRPVTAALAERWPGATWETTHLGGHRFAGTLLALPSGVVLGRVTGADAVDACTVVSHDVLPGGRFRGRAGLSAGAQVAELHVRAERPGPAAVRELADGRVEVATGDTSYLVEVSARPGPARRQSCADDRTKATTVLSVESVQQLP